jgi:hypothetical protein
LDFKFQDLRNFKDQGLFEGKFFFLKPTKSLKKNKDLIRIPSGDNEFKDYLTNHLTNKDTNVAYLLNEFIVGSEFTANVISKDGQLLVFQVNKSRENVGKSGKIRGKMVKNVGKIW